jgi:serine/alanine adding enzyme
MSVHLIASTEADAWREALPPDADIYVDPGYVAAASLSDPAWLAVVECGGGRLVLPFVSRALPPWLDSKDCRDAESVYGYPGVLASGDRGSWPACWRELTAALASQSIVNCFLRMHPLQPLDAVQAHLLPWEQPTVWIPLARGPIGAFAGGASRTHRSQVSRARALGFTSAITEEPLVQELEGFRVLYNQTMDRLGADPIYLFPAHYYDALRRGLGPRLALVQVRDADGSLHAAALFMRGPQWGHYHLSARRADAHNVAGHLMFQAAADWGTGHGLAGIHLGGGVTPSPHDALLQYKSRVGRMRAVFHCAGIVSMPDRHEALLARWSGLSGRAPSRFQAYRQRPAGIETAR